MKKRLSNKTIALLVAGALLFVAGGISGTRAALNVFSPEHFLDFDTADQDVSLIENGSVTGGTLLSGLEGKIIPGKEYDEILAARNNSDANQFVRIVVRKYWKDADGNKLNSEDEKELSLIKLENDSGSWQINSGETTAERTVYYYSSALAPGETTQNLIKSFSLDSSVAKKGTMSEKDDVYTYTYDYDGLQVCIEAEAQSIQTHNGADAVKSIWGVQNVTVSGSSLTVN